MGTINPKKSYEQWHDRFGVDQADTPWHRLVKAHIAPREDLVGKKVLEIGCGRGGFACWLAEQRPAPNRIVAADFSATAVQKGRSFAEGKRIGGIDWEIVDIQAIAHPDRSFDSVFSCETIEHVPSPGKAVRELSRVLKPGGKLFLTTPNYLGAIGLYRAYLRLRGRPYSEEGQPINNLMLLPRTRSMIAQAGLKVKVIDGIGHYVPLKGRPPLELPGWNNPRVLMRWLALHSLTIAEKPTLFQ